MKTTADPHVPELDANGRAAWSAGIDRLLNGRSQNDILADIAELAGEMNVGNFIKNKKGDFSRFCRGDRPLLTRWFERRERLTKDWLALFAQAAGVEVGRLWAELAAAAGTSSQAEPSAWHPDFPGVSLRDAWIPPRLDRSRVSPPLWKALQKRGWDGLVDELRRRVPELEMRTEAAEPSTPSAGTPLVVVVEGPPGSGRRTTARRLAQSLWKPNGPIGAGGPSMRSESEAQPGSAGTGVPPVDAAQGRAIGDEGRVPELTPWNHPRVRACDTEAGRLPLFDEGEGVPVVEILVRGKRGATPIPSAAMILSLRPWSRHELRALAKRLAGLFEVARATRNALAALAATPCTPGSETEEVGPAEDAIGVLAALVADSGSPSWTAARMADAVARRRWNRARRAPGAAPLAQVDQPVAEHLLARLCRARLRAGRWVWSEETVLQQIGSTMAASALQPVERPGWENLVDGIRRARTKSDARHLADNLARRLAEKDAHVLLQALVRSGLFYLDSEGVEATDLPSLRHLAARGLVTAGQLPWSAGEPEAALASDAPELTRALALAGSDPTAFLTTLASFPAWAEAEAAHLAVTFASVSTRDLDADTLALFVPLWHRALADIALLLVDHDGILVPREDPSGVLARVSSLLMVSKRFAGRLPSIDPGDESIAHPSGVLESVLAAWKERLPPESRPAEAGEALAAAEGALLLGAPFQAGTTVIRLLGLDRNENDLAWRRVRSLGYFFDDEAAATAHPWWRSVDALARQGDRAAALLLAKDSPSFPVRLPLFVRLPWLARARDRDESSWCVFLEGVGEALSALSRRPTTALFDAVRETLCELPEPLRDRLLGFCLWAPGRYPERALRPAWLKHAATPEECGAAWWPRAWSGAASVQLCFDLAVACRAWSFLRQVASLPFELMPSLSIGLVQGWPVLASARGGAMLALPGPDHEWAPRRRVEGRSMPLAESVDPAVWAWAMVLELAVRAAERLHAGAGDSASALRLALGDELDDGLAELMMASRWTTVARELASPDVGTDRLLEAARSAPVAALASWMAAPAGEGRTSQSPRLLLDAPPDFGRLSLDRSLRLGMEFGRGAWGKSWQGAACDIVGLLSEILPESAAIIGSRPREWPAGAEGERRVLAEFVLPALRRMVTDPVTAPPTAVRDWLASYLPAMPEPPQPPADRDRLRSPIKIATSSLGPLLEKMNAGERGGFLRSSDAGRYSFGDPRRGLARALPVRLRAAAFLLAGVDRAVRERILRAWWLEQEVDRGSGLGEIRPALKRAVLRAAWRADDDLLDQAWGLAQGLPLAASLMPDAVDGHDPDRYVARRPWTVSCLEAVPEPYLRIYLPRCATIQGSAPLLVRCLERASKPRERYAWAALLHSSMPRHEVAVAAIRDWAESDPQPWTDSDEFRVPRRLVPSNSRGLGESVEGGDLVLLEVLADLAESRPAPTWVGAALQRLWGLHVDGPQVPKPTDGVPLPGALAAFASRWRERGWSGREDALLDLLLRRGLLRQGLESCGYPLSRPVIASAAPRITPQRTEAWLGLCDAATIEAVLESGSAWVEHLAGHVSPAQGRVLSAWAERRLRVRLSAAPEALTGSDSNEHSTAGPGQAAAVVADSLAVSLLASFDAASLRRILDISDRSRALAFDISGLVATAAAARPRDADLLQLVARWSSVDPSPHNLNNLA